VQLIKVGADPEVGIYNTAKGIVVPGCGKIPGTKAKPHPVPNSKIGLKIQEDGVSLEYNFDPVPVKDFYRRALDAAAGVRKMVSALFGPDYDWWIGDGHTFDMKQLLPHPQAMCFGCDPDYLAHRRGEMRMPLDANDLGGNRFFAGHIHIGYDRKSCLVPDWAIVQGMEALAYTHLACLGYDDQPNRRKYYGIPGLFRPKSYGLEYRTPSNFWVHQPQHVSTLISTAEHIINKPAKFQEIYRRINFDDVVGYINDPRKRGTEVFVDSMGDLRDELFAAPEENIDGEEK